jgi:ribosomal protein S18 acetylase RimI-like enzyme
MRIRLFEWEKDLQEVLNLWRNAGPGVQLSPSDEPEAILHKLERDPDLFLVAEEDRGRVVGTVLGGYDGRRGLVYHLAVNKDHRRRGIGEALMVELERKLKAKGCYKSYLLVAPDNADAIDFYNRRGWDTMVHRVMGKVLE